MDREMQKLIAIRSEENSANIKTAQEEQLEERLRLLSDENQALFEQVEGYKVYFWWFIIKYRFNSKL